MVPLQLSNYRRAWKWTVNANNEQRIDQILTLEIRFTKIILTKIKQSCPLFKQRNISQQIKIKNLESLIQATLNCSYFVGFSDLETAIYSRSNTQQIDVADIEVTDLTVADSDSHEEETNTVTECDTNKMKPGEFVVGLFEDDFYVGEIIQKDSQDRYLISFMSRLKRGVADKDKYWIFPVTEDKQLMNGYMSI